MTRSEDSIDGDLLAALETATAIPFSEWPSDRVPFCAGVYTIWHDKQFLYVGMSGRGWSIQKIEQLRKDGVRRKGLFRRLQSHASGRRSGDQFCIYICDCLVLSELSEDELARIVAGRLSLDELTRNYIRQHLSFRFVEMPDGPSAHALESRIKKGALSAGKPLLNPG